MHSRAMLRRDGITQAVLCLILSLFVVSPAITQTIEEQADAGDTIASAQQLTGIPITSLTGTLSTTADIDLYLITIDDFASFSASTTLGPGTVDDTRLYLFTADGHAVYMNDDDPSDPLTNLSLLPAGHVLGPQSDGDYLLGVSLYYQTPTDQSSTKLFVEPDDEADPDNVDYTTINGPSSSLPLNAWTNNVDASIGSYGVTLTGVNGTLPLESSIVTAVSGPSGLTINWTAAVDHRVSHFEIEFSDSYSVDYRVVGSVASELLIPLSPDAMGSTDGVSVPGTQPANYSFFAEHPSPGMYIIRVSAIQSDGMRRVWGRAEVLVNTDARLSVTSAYPNPASNGATIELFALYEDNVTVELFDLTGRRFRLGDSFLMPAGSKREYWIELSDLAPGSYLIRVAGKQTVYSRSLTVVR